jgi:hypothetical protein
MPTERLWEKLLAPLASLLAQRSERQTVTPWVPLLVKQMVLLSVLR